MNIGWEKRCVRTDDVLAEHKCTPHDLSLDTLTMDVPMKDYVPLLQTVLWVSLILGLVFVFRAEVSLLRKTFAERVSQGAAVKVGLFELGELRDEMRSLRTGLDDVNKRIDKLFLATISQPMYENLKKLAAGRFGVYEMSPALERELYHLRDIGYIDVFSIKAIPKTGSNLSEHVKITQSGKEFVSLREMVYQGGI